MHELMSLLSLAFRHFLLSCMILVLIHRYQETLGQPCMQILFPVSLMHTLQLLKMSIVSSSVPNARTDVTIYFSLAFRHSLSCMFLSSSTDTKKLYGPALHVVYSSIHEESVAVNTSLPELGL